MYATSPRIRRGDVPVKWCSVTSRLIVPTNRLMPIIKPSVPKRNPSPIVAFLTQDELKRLVATIKDRRDRAIILMAYRHGLRASEIGLLQRADIDLKQGRVTIHRLKGSLSGVYPMQPGYGESLALISP